MYPHARWMKHMAMVPKGFLRQEVLKLLNEKNMSGSEIMSKIEEQTKGEWKPSPGSIYPLLAWLQDKGYIKGVGRDEAGTKRYLLTEQGKVFLEQHIKTREEMNRRSRHFGPGHSFMGPTWFEFFPEKAKNLQITARGLATAVWGLRDRLREEYSEKMVEDATNVLKEATQKINDITKTSQESNAPSDGRRGK